MQITKSIIRKLLRKHSASCTLKENLQLTEALEYIDTHLMFPYVIFSKAYVAVPENCYFNSDFAYIREDDYTKIEKQDSMVTSYGIVMWQTAFNTETFVHKFLMVLDDNQYEFYLKTVRDLNDQSIKDYIDTFARVVNKAHQTYVMNNDPYLPL